MFIKQWFVRYQDEATEGSEGSSASAEPVEVEGTKTEEASADKPAEFKLSESEAKLLKEVMSKKTKIKELESELTNIKSKISAFDGVDPDEIKNLLKEKADAEKSKLEAKGQWDALKEKMAKEHAAEKEAIAKSAEEAREQLRQSRQVIEKLTLTHQFDNSGFVKDDLVLTPRKAKAIYGEFFDIDENGTVIGYDKPRGDSTRTQLVNGSGDPLSFDEAMKRLVDADPDRDELLKAKRRTGAGSSASTQQVAPQRALRGIAKIEAALAQQK
jgi:hypothetical protein